MDIMPVDIMGMVIIKVGITVRTTVTMADTVDLITVGIISTICMTTSITVIMITTMVAYTTGTMNGYIIPQL